MSDLNGISFRTATNADCANVQNLVFDVLREYGLKPCLSSTDQDIADIEAAYLERGGAFELLEDEDGKLLGTVGLYPIDSEKIELRKMYFAKELRGKGLGKKTLRRMIDIARRAGYRQIYLETAGVLKEAVGLYRSFGFQATSETHTPRCDRAYFLELE